MIFARCTIVSTVVLVGAVAFVVVVVPSRRNPPVAVTMRDGGPREVAVSPLGAAARVHARRASFAAVRGRGACMRARGSVSPRGAAGAVRGCKLMCVRCRGRAGRGGAGAPHGLRLDPHAARRLTPLCRAALLARRLHNQARHICTSLALA